MVYELYVKNEDVSTVLKILSRYDFVSAISTENDGDYTNISYIYIGGKIAFDLSLIENDLIEANVNI